jgi:hypothetical protein
MHDEQLLAGLREIRDELRRLREQSRELHEKGSQQYQDINDEYLQQRDQRPPHQLYWMLWGFVIAVMAVFVANRIERFL